MRLTTQKRTSNGLRFSTPLIRKFCRGCLEVGVDGALPKDLATEVDRRGGYSLKYYDVARRLVRLNKKLQYETGKLLSEKRGKRWALCTGLRLRCMAPVFADNPVAKMIAVWLEFSEEENL